MVMTKEQRLALGEKRKELKQKRIEANRAKAAMKDTHEWATQTIQSTSIVYGSPSTRHMASHCKNCGYPWLMFKALPISCTEKTIKDIIV